ncbi:MAG: acyl-CoA thioesterase [Planctomycetes bacterium]|nr:acyl-CoA thioesterase [Planctomycetota bacterium]
MPTASASGSSSVRVRYCECDPMGVAHHASYIPWLEIGRTDLLRDTGLSYKTLEEKGYFLVIVKLEVKYRRPVLYDDIVEIRTNWIGGSRIKIEHTYEVVVTQRENARESLPLTAAVASTTLACVNHDGRPMELPDWLISRS